jgi:hypothetical protein
MGHDISACRIKANLQKGIEIESTEIAYLRFGAWNTVGQYLFYESLDAQQFNGGCSGNGEEEIYIIEQIKIAKEKLKYIYTEDDLNNQVTNYSNEEKHNMFKGLISMFGGNPDEMLSGENKEMLKYAIEDINKFYDNILNCGETEIVICFC